MIISGESSGELYGALLAKTLSERNDKITILGVGGDRMESSGVHLLSRISSALGLTEVFKTYHDIKITFDRVVSTLGSFKPQALVLIDYPDFNIRVAKKAKKLGIPVLYYVSPQVWAWRKGRLKVLARLVNTMAVILPFEEEIYRAENIPCEFVGHPIVEEMLGVIERAGYGAKDIGSRGLKEGMKKEIGLLPTAPVMTLMPGSRPKEIEKLLPVMAEVIPAFKKRYPSYQYVLPVAPNVEERLFSHTELRDTCRVVKGKSTQALLASDVAVIASGTSTLQAALLKIPMVVVYRISPLTYFMVKPFVKVTYVALANILLEKSLASDSGLRVRELLQRNVTVENIVKELARIVDDRPYRDTMLTQFQGIAHLFLDKRPSRRVAEMVESLCN